MKPNQLPALDAATESGLWSEEKLVDSLKRKEQTGFSYLFDHYAGSLYGHILKIVPEHHLANDILQEVFTNIWRKIDSFDPAKARLFTWMFNIARNSSIDMLRSKAYKKTLNTKSFIEGYDYSNQSGQVVELHQDGMYLRKIIDHLRPEIQQMIDLFYFRGYTHELIADITGIPVGTVKTRIRSGLRQLKCLF